MTERIRFDLILLDQESIWSKDYLHQLNVQGISTTIRPPVQGSIRPEYPNYLLPVYDPQDPRFELVEYITNSGLSVIVLAGRNLSATATRASMHRASCFQKNSDTSKVVAYMKKGPHK